MNFEAYHSFSFKYFLYLMLVPISMVPGYLLLKYGINFGDEPYQIMNTMDIHRSAMAPLTGWLGNIFGRMNDFRWMSFRYLSLTLNNIAFIIGGIYLYQKSKSASLAAVTCAVVILLSGISRCYHNLYGWDIWTVLFMSWLIYGMLTFIDKPTIWRLMMISAVTALATAVRLPNVVVIPIIWGVLLFLSLRGEKHYKKYNAWLFLLVSVSLTIAIIVAIFGSAAIFLTDFQSNMLSSHSIKDILWGLINNVCHIAITAMALKTLIIILSNSEAMNKTMRIMITIASCIAIIFFLLPLAIRPEFYDIYWLILALFTIMRQAWSKRNINVLVKIMTIILLGLACTVGSNTGLLKFPGYILAPFVTTFLLPLFGIEKIKYFACVAVIPYMIYVIIIAIPNYSFLDAGIKETTECIPVGRAKNIHTVIGNVEKVIEIEQFNNSLNHDVNLYVVGEGYDRFLYEYLLGCTDSYSRHEWNCELPMLDDDKYVVWLDKQVRNQAKPVVLYVKRPNGSSKIQDFLNENMIKYEEYSSFIVYRSKNENKIQ